MVYRVLQRRSIEWGWFIRFLLDRVYLLGEMEEIVKVYIDPDNGSPFENKNVLVLWWETKIGVKLKFSA